MKPAIDLAEFRSGYLAEVDEHLGSATAHLLAMEGALQRGESIARAVRELFRALHTIKGLSAMIGVEPIVAIAHRMESALRAADRGGGALPPGAVDTLLQGVRAIEVRVRAIAESAAVPEPPAPLLDALDAIDGSAASPSIRGAAQIALDPEMEGKLSAVEKEQLTAGLRAGKRVVRVDFSPSPARVDQGLTINSVRERVGTVAELVKVVPVARSPSDTVPTGLTFALVLLSSVSNEAIAAAAGLDPGDVRPLSIHGPSREQGGAAEAAAAPAAPDARALAGWDELNETELPRRGVLRVDVDRIDEAMERLSALVVTRYRLERCTEIAAQGAASRELRQILGEHARQLRDLRAALLRVRMVPVGEVLDRVPLIVRGLRRSTGKPVRIEIEGGGAELDKAVAERIFPAIVHLVRNAVDHGIELPDERARAGKPEEGVLRIACTTRGNTVLELSISDDGQGIDRVAVARRAGGEISDAALLEIICAPGMSTRTEATTTSGRGMGLDIVRRVVVDELGGELSLRTAKGVGTTFTLRVPLTIAIIDAFAFQCAEQRFVVPVSMVEEIVEIDPATVRTGPGRTALFERRGEAVPVVALEQLLWTDAAHSGEAQVSGKALVVRRGAEPMAFAVDRLLGQREAVVRPLDDPLIKVPGVSGATDLGDGRPTLVLDLVALATTASGARGVTRGALGRSGAIDAVDAPLPRERVAT